MAKALHFKSKTAYRKWNAFRHIHHIRKRHKRRYVYIAGKRHYKK